MSHENQLRGRVAIVTGSGHSGEELNIGRAIALVLARRGAVVGIVDRDEGAALATVNEIESREGGVGFHVTADVSDEASCSTVVSEAVRRHGRIDILVNNVGVSGSLAQVTELDVAVWTSTLTINLTSMFLMCKKAIPVMPPGSSIVNLSSVAAHRPGNATAYGPSKAAVESLTQALAAEYGLQGIRANAVSPGAMWTPMVARMCPPSEREQWREQRRLENLLETEGTAWDCAHAVAFLASDDARWITGQTLTVDGGSGLR